MTDVKVTVFDKTQNYSIPENPKDFLKYFTDKLKEVPAEFRKAAKIKLSVVDDYDGHSLNVEVSYTRPQTLLELQAAEDLIARNRARVLQHELSELNRLKKKYEEKPQPPELLTQAPNVLDF